MPALSCRESGFPECDWFFRESDAGKVLITATEHVESAHPEQIKELMDSVGPSGTIEWWDKVMRKD